MALNKAEQWAVDTDAIAEELGRLRLLAKLLSNQVGGISLGAEELGILGGLVDECANSIEGFTLPNRHDLELHLVRKAAG